MNGERKRCLVTESANLLTERERGKKLFVVKDCMEGGKEGEEKGNEGDRNEMLYSRVNAAVDQKVEGSVYVVGVLP